MCYRVSKMTFIGLSTFFVLQIATIFAEAKTKLPVGVTDFSHLIRSKYLFVDKTEFIKDVMTKALIINTINRPRGFGKSLSLSMLQYFLDCRKPPLNTGNIDLFEGLKISKDKQFCAAHRNQWPVIHLSFQYMNATDIKDAQAALFRTLQTLYKEHSYLLEGDILTGHCRQEFSDILNGKAPEVEMKSALSKLCHFIYIKHAFKKKIILLVDDFDVPFEAAYLHDYYWDLKHLIQEVTPPSCLQHSPFAHKAIFMSSSGISPKSTFEHNELLNDYTIFREKFASDFGFTFDDVSHLLTQSGTSVNQKVLTKWYGGYNAAGIALHNPWSVLSCLNNKGKTGPYWAHVHMAKLVDKQIRSAGVAEMVRIKYFLMNGRKNSNGSMEMELEESVTLPDLSNGYSWMRVAFWSVLVHAGYLSVEYKRQNVRSVMCLVRIPNKEIRDEIDSWYDEKFRKRATTAFKQVDGFVKNIKDGNVGKIKEFIWNCIAEKGSYYSFTGTYYKGEGYHNYLRDLFAPLKEYYKLGCHKTNANDNLDPGYYLTLVPRDSSFAGVIFQLETSEETKESKDLKGMAEKALQRIKERNATSKFAAAGCKKLIGVGLGVTLQALELDSEDLQVH